MDSIITTRPPRHPVLLFAALGVFSGALSSIVTWVIWESIIPESPFAMPDPVRLPHGYVPGLVFGVVIGIGLVRLGHSNVLRAAVFALGATASCFIAYLGYFVLPATGPLSDRIPAYPVAGLAASALGSLLIAATAAALFPVVRNYRTIVLVVVVGGALGAVSDVFAPVVSEFASGVVWKLGAVAFYAVWQGAVAGALATGVRRTTDGGAER